MKIGIYGGSFDPIHTGHAMVANFVAQCNVVDEVWIMVSRRNPLKLHDTEASDTQRLEMARLVVKECADVKVSEIEMEMPTPSYTIDTLNLLKKRYPNDEFRIIIGSDSIENFPKWKKADELLRNFGVIVYPRPGFPFPEEEQPGMKFLTGAPENSISSSLIREYVRSGWNINYFVPLAVSEYIIQHNLYQ